MDSDGQEWGGVQVRIRNLDGSFSLSHVDECVDQMLHTDLLFDIALPRIPHRCAGNCQDLCHLQPGLSCASCPTCI